MKDGGVERELAALETAELGAVRAALKSAHGRVVQRAAELARRESMDAVQRELSDAFVRLVPLGAGTDPGCRAKVAILEALDALGWDESAPFVAATRVVQREKAWGPPVDTASGVRARGVLALARQAHPDLPLIAAELLFDPDAPVRIAAADAIAAHRSRDGAGALVARLACADEDPNAIAACVSALLALAPEHALALARRGQVGGATLDREAAALALGASRRDDALDVLLEWLETSATSDERAPILAAVGLHRTERALATLLARICEGSEADALAAIHALRARRFDSGVVARARAAGAERSAQILRAIDEQLGAD